LNHSSHKALAPSALQIGDRAQIFHRSTLPSTSATIQSESKPK
jgi:hypothetical protein